MLLMIWRSMLPASSGRPEKKKLLGEFVTLHRKRGQMTGIGNNDKGKMKSSDSIS
jgi:hypothetical protein